MELVIEDSPLEDSNDLLQQLGADNARHVLQYLESPADLAHLAAVSQFWRHFVAESHCFRDLCIKLFPEVSKFACAIEIGQQVNSEGASLSKGTEWQNPDREYRVYTQLTNDLLAPPIENSCIEQPISASSTDNFPDESIMYTLDPLFIEDDRPSYWSSKGESNPDVPETLTYRLSSRLCVVHEVKIRPFQAYFQMGFPIYSAKAVRIRLGHARSSTVLASEMLGGMMPNDRSASEDYVWTYVSPEFPMQQGKTPEHPTFTRRINFKHSHYQNQCCALGASCRLNCWEEFRNKKWMDYIIFVFVMPELLEDLFLLHLILRLQIKKTNIF